MKRLCAWILALVLLLSATALASVTPEADKTALRAGETVNAVSYTHLTLPTKA